MPSVSTGSTSIPFGATLRIGYRTHGGVTPFTYLTHFPSYNELPYSYSLPVGVWDVEYTTVCPACNGSQYSSSQIVVISAT